MVLISLNPIHSVFFLILVFCNVLGLLLLIGINFFAFLFLMIYVGAIVILFLFLIIMLNIKVKNNLNIFNFLPIGFLVCCFFMLEILIIIQNYSIIETSQIFLDINFNFKNIQNIFNSGEILANFVYTDFFIFFLLVTLGLLIAMIGTIILTINTTTNIKKQLIFQQISRKFQNSLFLVQKYK